MKLTNASCKSAKPSEKPRKLSDGKGLYLEIRPNGSKWWRLKYRIGGKEKRISLGVYPDTSLKEARDKCDTARKQIAEGQDPSLLRKETQAQQIMDSTNSFEAIARDWFVTKRERWSDNHALKIIGWLEKDIFPYLGERPIDSIKPKDVIETIQRIEKREALDMARRLLRYCNHIFQYAIIHERIEHNPAADIHSVLKEPPPVKHRAYLTEAELPTFLKHLERYEGELQTRLALKLKMLTLLRTLELRAAKWEEIDWQKKEWHIPVERMKMKRPHIVPLSDQAIAILDQLRRLNGNREHIFPSHHKPSNHISENTMLYAMYRMGYRGQATPHGFRSTASTILNENKFRSDVIEIQLAHVEGNNVRKAYNHAQYMDERREMLQWWADYLDKL